MSTFVTYPALSCQQNNWNFFITTLPKNILDKICYISRREDNTNQGFQRSLNENRAKDIAKYLDKGHGVIPSALILSAKDSAEFEFNNKNKEVKFKAIENSFMVLDGQHRLYGLKMSEQDYNMPVIIFNGLKTADEVNLFIDINTTQKGVPTTLLLDIKSLTGEETSKEEKQRTLFDELNKDSVLKGSLSASKSQVGKLTRVSFNQATSHIFDSGYFSEKKIDTVIKVVKNYLEACDIVIHKNPNNNNIKLTTSTYFKAFFSIFNDVVNKSLNEFNDVKVESLVSVLSPISNLNLNNYTGTNNATLIKIISDFNRELINAQNPLLTNDDNLF